MSENYGLIISCNYPNTGSELNGCYNDGNSYKKFLEEKLKINNFVIMNDIDYNKNEEYFPTSNNIIKQIEKLSKLDINHLFIYFSGHGSYISDWSLDESLVNDPNNINSQLSLNKDSILITNEGDKIGYLVDDKINELLRLFKKDTIIFACFDCCHSGTICDLKYVYAPIKELLGYKIYKMNYQTDEMNAKVIKIAGTRDNSVAYETFLKDKVQGVLTFFLIENLNKCLENKINLNDLLLNLTNQITKRLNSEIQIPVLSTSHNLDLNNSYINKLESKNIKYFTLTIKEPIKNNSFLSGCK